MGDYKSLIFTYINDVWRRRWLALVIAWAVCALGWGIIALLPDSYRSEARIYVDTQSLLDPLLKGISVRSDEVRDQDVIVMQRTLNSRSNVEKVVRLTDLDKTAKSPADLQNLVNKIQDHIIITGQTRNLFKVDYTNNLPRMAQRVLQTLLTIFVESSTGDRQADMQAARSFIEAQLALYSAKLVADEKRLADFKIANIDYVADPTTTFSTRVDLARTTVKERSDDVEDLTEQIAELRSRLATTPQLLSIDSVPQVVVGRSGPPLRQRIWALQGKVDELRLQYTDRYPELARTLKMVRKLQAQAAKVDELPRNDTNSSDGGVERSEIVNDVYTQLSLRLSDLNEKLSDAKHRLNDARNTLADLQNKSARAPGIEAEFTALNRDYNILKGNYESLLARRESARIAEAADAVRNPVQIKIIAKPEESAFPVGPKRRIFNAGVFIIGVAAGCASAIALAKIEDCITNPDDLYEFTGKAAFGCISDAVTLLNRAPFIRRYRGFLLFAGALSLLALVSVLAAPNLSAVPQAVALNFAAL